MLKNRHHDIYLFAKDKEGKMYLIILFVLMGFKQPEVKPCVVDQCEDDVCVIETPEGWVVVDRHPDYYEGKRLPLRECPMVAIDPT